jgi:hypothetical protein
MAEIGIPEIPSHGSDDKEGTAGRLAEEASIEVDLLGRLSDETDNRDESSSEKPANDSKPSWNADTLELRCDGPRLTDTVRG